jgi:prepilin-type N-terminal cleavage/methylation domain-containing protein/prepilin-type processing-associated H-X9-DG protein
MSFRQTMRRRISGRAAALNGRACIRAERRAPRPGNGRVLRRRGGFTLVELLVVIVIIAVLMGLALPVIGRVRETARSAQCVSNLKQLYQASMNYASDNGGSLPHSSSREIQDSETLKWSKERTGWVDWHTDPTGYPNNNTGGNKRTYWRGTPAERCIERGTLFAGGYTRGEKRIYLCPTFARREICGRGDARRSYAMSARVSGANIMSSSHVILNASRTLMFADAGVHAFPVQGVNANRLALIGLRGRHVDNWDVNTYENDEWHWTDREYYRQLDASLIGSLWVAGGVPHEAVGNYHNGLGNAVFMDGHIRKIRPQDTIDAYNGVYETE